MTEKQRSSAAKQFFTLHMIERDVQSLESFLATEKPQFGLPLPELGVELGCCCELISLISEFSSWSSGFTVSAEALTGQVALLKNRLSIVAKVLDHGVVCCGGTVLVFWSANPVFLFNVCDESTSLEEYYCNHNRPNGLPLRNVRDSIEQCVALLDSLLTLDERTGKVVVDDRVSVVCKITHLICHQLDMVNRAIDRTQETAVRVLNGGACNE